MMMKNKKVLTSEHVLHFSSFTSYKHDDQSNTQRLIIYGFITTFVGVFRQMSVIVF